MNESAVVPINEPERMAEGPKEGGEILSSSLSGTHRTGPRSRGQVAGPNLRTVTPPRHVRKLVGRSYESPPSLDLPALV